jgi:hypothetical protein
VTQPGALTDSTGDSSGERSPALRAGDVLALMRRGAQGRAGHAATIHIPAR